MTTLLALSLALLTPPQAPGAVTITQAVRSVETQAYGYDWEFDGGDGDASSSLTTGGAFNDTVHVDLDEWYGGHIGTGAATVASNLSPSEISASFDLYASCLNVGVFQADCSSYGDLDVTIHIAQRVRVKLSFDAFCYDDYAAASAELRRVGASTALLSLQVFGDDDGGAGQTTWLQVGDYRCRAEANCGAFGAYGSSDDATALLDVALRFFDAADFDANGRVDRHDRMHFAIAFSSGSLAADIDGGGFVTNADSAAFRTAWQLAAG